MGTLTATSLTLVDLAGRRDPDGTLAKIAEILNQSNPFIADMPWMEANGVTSHEVTRRNALPTGTWRQVNQGVDRVKTRTTKVVEGIGMLMALSAVDEALVDMAPNPMEFRNQEALGVVEGLSQQQATALMYGNAQTDPEQITGLAPRLASLDTDGMVLDGGGSSGLTSVYVVQWGPMSVFAVHPKGSAEYVGVTHKDEGRQLVQDGDGKEYFAYMDKFELRMGLVVRDSRCIGRIANIDASDNKFDEDDLITLLNRMPYNAANAMIYCNERVKTQMEIALKDKANVNFNTVNGLSGEPVTTFRGHPVLKCDAILNTESAVS